MTNFLHHFDEATCVGFLKKVRAATAPGGQLMILEFIPNEDRVTPPEQAGFSLVMLATTARGDAYTLAQLDSMLEEAGFSRGEMHRLQPLGDLVISHRA